MAIGRHILQDDAILLNTVPGVIRHLLQEETNLGNVNVINMAGEPIPSEVLQTLDLERIKVRNLYGPTEDTTYSTVCRLKNGQGHLIGKPIDNTSIYILDEQVRLCPIGCPGEICIAGEGLARGYLNRPAMTTEKFVPDPFVGNGSARMYKTGDLGRWTEDGNIEYLGRIDQQVKIRGYRIEPGEIERVLQESPLVNQAVVIARKEEADTRLIAYVVPEGRFDREGILGHLRSKLPGYMIPALFVGLDKIPLTRNGKVDKSALPGLNSTDPQGHEFVEPRNEVEQKLAAIWKELLRIEQIGVYENFFEAGGHSLSATRLVSAIRKNFMINIPIRVLFEYNTINDLAKYIELETFPGVKEESPELFDVINI